MRNSNEDNSLVEVLRLFQKSNIYNRRCANCNEIGPNYICIDFGTFVCSTCSGIHRELNHKVKSISISKWTTEEVKHICNNGNEKDTLKFLENRNTYIDPPPSSDRYIELKEFIKNKYINCLWVKEKKNCIHINSNSYNIYVNSDSNLTKQHIETSNIKNKKTNIDRNPFSIFCSK